MSGFEELHYCFSQLGTIVHSIKNNYYLFIRLILPVFIKKKKKLWKVSLLSCEQNKQLICF